MSGPGNAQRSKSTRPPEKTNHVSATKPVNRDLASFIPREGLSNNLFVQCQDHLQVINTAIEYQLTIKNEMKKFSKLERAIAYKKNGQAERISEILGAESSQVSNPVWFIRSIQSLASRLVQQAKSHCANTEKLSRFCDEIQDLADHHFRVLESVYESADHEHHDPPAASPPNQPKSDSIARPRVPRKKTTERKTEGGADQDKSLLLLSPPPTTRSKPKSKVSAAPEESKDPEKGIGVEDFRQASVMFEVIRRKRLAFSNRVEYLKRQRESISVQLVDTNAHMTLLTDGKTGKLQQWTTQSKLGDVRSRRDFLQQNKKQLEEESRRSALELHEFDATNKSSLDQIRNVFAATKTKYERLLQNSICALESVVGSDVEDLAQTEATCANRIYFMKSTMWETFDNKLQAGDEAKGSYGDGRLDCNNDAYSTNACLPAPTDDTRAGHDKNKTTQLHKPKDARKQASRKKSGTAAPNSTRGSTSPSLSPDISDGTSEDETDVLNKDSTQRLSNPFNSDASRLSASGKSTHSSDSKTGTSNNAVKIKSALKSVDGREDRTNNHDVRLIEKYAPMSAESSEDMPTDESPDVFLICSKRGKPVGHSRCSIVSRDYLDAPDRDPPRVKDKEEEEVINRYLNKYLLRLSRSGMPEFERSQRLPNVPERFVVSDKKSYDEKVVQPIVIPLDKESGRKVNVRSMNGGDILDRGIDQRTQSGLCLSDSPDPCSDYDNPKDICQNNLSRDENETPTNVPRDPKPRPSGEHDYNIMISRHPVSGKLGVDHDHTNITSRNEEEVFDSGDIERSCDIAGSGIKRDSTEPDIVPRVGFGTREDEVLSGCSRRSNDIRISQCKSDPPVATTNPSVYRASAEQTNRAMDGSNVTNQITSFLALMAKETKTVMELLDPDTSNLVSDTESLSTVTSLSCLSAITGACCPDLDQETGSKPGGQHLGQDSRCKTPSQPRRVRFKTEIEYSSDLGDEDVSPTSEDYQ